MFKNDIIFVNLKYTGILCIICESKHMSYIYEQEYIPVLEWW